MPGEFACPWPTCSATFTRMQHVTRHARIHTGDKPYACNLCDDSFPRSDLLSRHRSRVHGAAEPSPSSHRRKRKSNSGDDEGGRACGSCSKRKIRCTMEDGRCAQCEHKDLICIYPSSLHSAAARHAQLPPRPRSTPGSGPSTYDPPRVTFHEGGTSSSLPSVLPEVDFVPYPLYSPSLSYEHDQRDGSSSSSSSTGSGSSVGSPPSHNMPIYPPPPHPTSSQPPYSNLLTHPNHQQSFHPDLFPPSTSTSSTSAASSAFPPSFLFHPHPSAPSQPSAYPPSNGSRPGSYAYLDETLPWGSSVTGDLAVAWGLQNQQRGGCGVLPATTAASYPMPMGGGGGAWNMWGATATPPHPRPTTEQGGWGTVERIGAHPPQPQLQPQQQNSTSTSTSPTRSSYASDISQYTQSLLLTHHHPPLPHPHTHTQSQDLCRPGVPANPYPPPQHATPTGQAQLDALFATWAGPETVGGGGGEDRGEKERDRGERQGRVRVKTEAEVPGWA